MRRTILLVVATLVAAGLLSSPAAAAEASVRGRVVDSAGQPLAGVRVTPWYELSPGSFTELSSYYTNAEGWFRVGDDLTNSTVRLRFVDEDGRGLTEFYDNATDLASATDIDVATTDVVLGDIELPPASHITGRLTGEDGTGLLSGQVYAYAGEPGDWDLVGRGETDGEGRYDVGGLPAGAYRLKFADFSGERFDEVYEDVATLDEGTDVLVGVDETVTGIDAVLDTQSSIVGRVTDGSGAPTPGISVLAYAWTDGAWQRVPTGRASSGQNGWYEVYNLAAGPHRLEFRDDSHDLWLPGFYPDAPDLASATTIDVPAATRHVVADARLTRAARVMGTVSDPAGDAVSTDVTAYRWVDDAWVAAATDQTDYAGLYDLRGLTAGSYVVGFEGGEGMIDQYYPSASSPQAAVPVVLADEELREGIDAQLAEAPFAAVTTPALNLYGDPTQPSNNAEVEATWATWNLWPESRSWQWFRDGVPVPGDGDRYDLEPADLGSVITVQETAWSTFGQQSVAESAPLTVPGSRSTPTPSPSPTPTTTPSVTPSPTPVSTPTPTPTAAPTPTPTETAALAPIVRPRLVGRQRVGDTLRVSRGTWPVDQISWRFRWYADGDRVRGAHERTLRIRPGLVRARLTVRVVARADDHLPWRGRLSLDRSSRWPAPGKRPVD